MGTGTEAGARLAAEHGAARGAARLEEMLAGRQLRVLRTSSGRLIVPDRDCRSHEDVLAEVAFRSAAAAPPLDEAALEACMAAAPERPDPSQEAALRGVLSCPTSVIHGPPGSGKSTILAVLSDYESRVRPGRAAVVAAFSARIALATGLRCRVRGATLHSLTGTKPGTEVDAGRPLDASIGLVMVDEAFSATPQMLLRVLRQAPRDCRVVLAGDPGQLLPIGDGRLLHDMLEGEVVPAYRLSTSHRLGAGGHLDAQVARVARGLAPSGGPGLRLVAAPDGPAAEREEATAAFAARLHAASRRAGLSCIVLTGTRHGTCGHVAMNRRIAGSDHPGLGDEVITTGEDPGRRWRNGERGVVASREGDLVEVEFDRGAAVWADRRSPGLTLGYAVSGHRAQGLQCDRAVVILDAASRKVVSRQYLTSVLSRARECVVVSAPGMMALALRRDEAHGRPAVLQGLLRERARGA